MRPTRILLVDDNPAIRETLREIIEENPGWRICGEAAEGRTAISQARKLRPDLIILDYHMPELDGVEAAGRILQQSPQTPIVFFTAEISHQVASQVLALGVRSVITKGGGGYLELLTWIERLSPQQAGNSRPSRSRKRAARTAANKSGNSRKR